MSLYEVSAAQLKGRLLRSIAGNCVPMCVTATGIAQTIKQHRKGTRLNSNFRAIQGPAGNCANSNMNRCVMQMFVTSNALSSVQVNTYPWQPSLFASIEKICLDHAESLVNHSIL